ncbi:fimbrial protein [Comamonas sp. wu1-DMT]|uniref:fimbrial protein n=1 Tax=Comamonas sp. wu1-DMT TaxID=3126390 RepID=UPI0032E436E9
MKKLVMSLAVLSALGAASIAQAAPADGAKGLIKFTGVINADTCVLSSPSGTIAGKTLTVDMQEVPAASLGTEDAPTTTGNGLTAEARDLDLDIQCATGTKVSMSLTPSAPSGKGIAVEGGAKNVQIVLTRDGNLVDFTSGSADVAASPAVDGKFRVPLKAYYTRVAGKAQADVTVGAANATVNYVLKYE